MKEVIKDRLNRAVKEKVFPGGVVGVVQKNGEKVIIPAGSFTYDEGSRVVEAETPYDLASLTKSIPTASVALSLIEQGKLSLDDQFTLFVPECTNQYREKILIRHLLTYSIIGNLPTPGFSFQTATAETMWQNLLSVDLKYPPGDVSQYSNMPALFLTKVIERVTGKGIDVLGREYFFEPLDMLSAIFLPLDHESVPPTEIDAWRGLVQGFVHDETSYILQRDNEASCCAGLFANAPDILKFIEMLLNEGKLHGKRYFSPETVRTMYTNQLASIGASMGLGWELNDPQFMGRFSSETMFGKTGFTGTSCVLDIPRGVGYVLLSNRTYPKRTSADAIRQVRRDISDIVFTNER